jgi:hypothetical protein
MHIGGHREKISFDVISTPPGVDIYLPAWWFAAHEPSIDYENGRLLGFPSAKCEGHHGKPKIRIIDTYELVGDEDYVNASSENGYGCGVVGWCASVEAGVELVPARQVMSVWKDYAYGEKPAIRWQVDTIEHAEAEGARWEKVFPELFSDERGAALPAHAPYDHKIELVEDAKPFWGPVYQLSELEKTTLKDYLRDMLEQGKIRPSRSPFGAPILFVKKKNGELRLCVDYRGLNKITIKNRYPLPLMSQLREQIGKSKIFTSLDLRNGYNLIRIAKGDEYKTAFRTHYGQYEYLVMPFGLCNAPATFQEMMNEIFRDLLDCGVAVYLDDVLIYAETREEHDRLVHEVLSRLDKYGLALQPKKCHWAKDEVEFLGFIINGNGVEMAKDKVQAILDWPIPTNKKALQSFLGLANFYRMFIKDFSKKVHHLTDLTGKSNTNGQTSIPRSSSSSNRLSPRPRS